MSGEMERRTGMAIGRTVDSSLMGGGGRGVVKSVIQEHGINLQWNEASYGLHDKETRLSHIPCSAGSADGLVELKGRRERERERERDVKGVHGHTVTPYLRKERKSSHHEHHITQEFNHLVTKL